MNFHDLNRCDYCARVMYKNVSGKYKLCSLKCKSYFKKNKTNHKLETIILQNISKGWSEINTIFIKVNFVDKFEFISVIGRMIYFEKTLKTKTINELSMLSYISKVKK